MTTPVESWGPFWSRERWLALALACAALVVALGLGAARGSVAIPLPTVTAMIARRAFGHAGPVTWPATWETILFQVRLPRVFLAALVGAALSLAGVTYQGLFHNPLADPYLVGVSSGAGLGPRWPSTWGCS